MMQDCTRIRALEGSRTLLTWSQDTTAATRHTTTPAEPVPTTESASAEGVKDCGEDGCGCQHSSTNAEAMELTPETRLSDLLKRYPTLRDELPSIHSAFSMLRSPLARIIIPKANVRMMSERSGMPLDKLLLELNALISKLSK